MSKHGQARAVQAQAYGSAGGGGPITQLAAFGLVVVGFACVALAVASAIMPVAPEPAKPVLDGIERLGLDKGPLALFGLLMFGMGLALSRLTRSQGGSKAAARAAAFAEQTAGDLDGVSAILASVQAELGALRHQVGEVQTELELAKAPSTGSGGETANDPIFRLAASLDQLGARVDKRIEGTRTELIDAVESMSKTISDVTREQIEASREQRTEFEGLRMDMVDLHAEIARVTEDVSATKEAIASVKSAAAAAQAKAAAQPPAPRPAAPAGPGASAVTGAAASPGASASPGAGTPSSAAAPTTSGARPSSPSAGATPTSGTGSAPEKTSETFEFPSPPPPIPSASEGLELLDDMAEDRARDGDKAPPLFPDLDGNSAY